jgi:hypothetical protein
VIRESFERFYPETKQASTLKRVTEVTGRSIADDAFVDWEATTSFFKEEGFAVERFKQIDLVRKCGVVSSSHRCWNASNMKKYG